MKRALSGSCSLILGCRMTRGLVKCPGVRRAKRTAVQDHGDVPAVCCGFPFKGHPFSHQLAGTAHELQPIREMVPWEGNPLLRDSSLLIRQPTAKKTASKDDPGPTAYATPMHLYAWCNLDPGAEGQRERVQPWLQSTELVYVHTHHLHMKAREGSLHTRLGQTSWQGWACFERVTQPRVGIRAQGQVSAGSSLSTDADTSTREQCELEMGQREGMVHGTVQERCFRRLHLALAPP